jgi:hypothetical protein
MISNVEYDMSNLQEKISGMMGALLGRGAGGGDGHNLLRTETGQLAGRIGDAVGPKTQAAAAKRIDRDIGSFLVATPKYSNLDEEQQESSRGDFTWLAAGPNFLLGINDEDNRPDAGGFEALAMFRAGQKSGDRGARSEYLGQRGGMFSGQRVSRVNRTRVSASALLFVRQFVMQRSGELRAAFYRVAKLYVPSKRVPGWVESKIDQVIAAGKSSVAEGGMATPEAFIEFAVRAAGVDSNPKIVTAIQSGMRQSAYIAAGKLKKILQGYKYEWATGRVFRQKTNAVEDYEAG